MRSQRIIEPQRELKKKTKRMTNMKRKQKQLKYGNKTKRNNEKTERELNRSVFSCSKFSCTYTK